MRDLMRHPGRSDVTERTCYQDNLLFQTLAQMLADTA
jgi:hypothetical protein